MTASKNDRIALDRTRTTAGEAHSRHKVGTRVANAAASFIEVMRDASAALTSNTRSAHQFRAMISRSPR